MCAFVDSVSGMCLKEYYIIELSYQNSEIALRYANPLCTGRARPIDFFAPEFLWEASKKCSVVKLGGNDCGLGAGHPIDCTYDLT